jgi:formamidopyrimidine-DNA glycosylase
VPELPEVETVVRQLAGELPGLEILDVVVQRPDLLREPVSSFRTGIRGRSIESVSRRGKNILLALSGSSLLLVNLGMTGRLLHGKGIERQGPPPYLGVRFLLGGSGPLLYTDVRRFGHLLRYSQEEWGEESRRLGPEPLDPELTAGRFHSLLQASRSPIRSWLLDQTRIAGIGNIYAAESLFRGGIHPTRPANDLSMVESEALLRGMRSVLQEAILARGTTLRDYRTASGEEGGFGPTLEVYGREGEACRRCKLPLERIVFANRSAFLCPRCQPEST